MSDAARASRTHILDSCEHTDYPPCRRCAERAADAYAAEQTAVLERQIAKQDESIARLRDERDAAREQTTALRAEAAQVAEEWAQAYPLDIFREPPPGEHGQTVDACAARAARHVANGIAKQIRALLANAEGPEPAMNAQPDVNQMRAVLGALYTFPGVRDLLAPSGSLGSLADQVEAIIYPRLSAHASDSATARKAPRSAP